MGRLGRFSVIRRVLSEESGGHPWGAAGVMSEAKSGGWLEGGDRSHGMRAASRGWERQGMAAPPGPPEGM